jgi:hypothetical protein
MLGGFISGLLVAWILSWFGVHCLIISAVQPFTGVELTAGLYYLAFGLVGLVGGAFRR